MDTKPVALIVGVTGIVGRHLSNFLVKNNWTVYGIARRSSQVLNPSVTFLSVDVFDKSQCDNVSKSLGVVTHLFYCTWVKKSTEEENCKANSEMLTNILDSLINHQNNSGKLTLKRVTLVTGTKHYLGPFESYGKQKARTPFEESHPRLPIINFYYTLEDVIIERSKKYGFTWTVARPHSIFGYSPGNLMNLGTSIAVYATLCKYSQENGGSLKFSFPGSPTQYHGVVDVTSADLLAEHLLWEATCPTAGNNAFNVVNGDVFRWENMWEKIAEYFGVPVGEYPGEARPLSISMEKPEVETMWSEIVKKYNLQNYKLLEIAPWWHVDADLGRPVECINSMNKSKEMGFAGFRNTEKAILALFDILKKEKIIP